MTYLNLNKLTMSLGLTTNLLVQKMLLQFPVESMLMHLDQKDKLSFQVKENCMMKCKIPGSFLVTPQERQSQEAQFFQSPVDKGPFPNQLQVSGIIKFLIMHHMIRVSNLLNLARMISYQ